MSPVSLVCSSFNDRLLRRVLVLSWFMILVSQPMMVFATESGQNSMARELDAVLDQMVQAPDTPIHSVILQLNAPKHGFTYQGAAGKQKAGSEHPAGPNDRFYIASISKAMTAVRTLQLVESGLFTLDTPVADLGVLDSQVTQALHQIGETSYGSAITIRQLLSHRSGMKDYLLDDRTGISSEFESGLAPGSMAAISMSQWAEFLECSGALTGCSEQQAKHLYPARPWLPWGAAAFSADPQNRDAGLLNFYLAEMADSALFPPGTGNHYSDTNFLLLGVIIEQLTGTSLQQQFEEGIFKPLAMRNSRLPSPADPARSAADTSNGEPLTDFWIGDTPFPSSGIDTSWDWGGGGVISNAPDLAVFLQALAEGRLFRNPETLKQMLDFYPIRTDGEVMQVGYGLGIRYSRSEYGPRWGHGGAWGAKMEYFPELGLFVTGTVNAYGVGESEILINESLRIFNQHKAELPQPVPPETE